ncbi:MAG: alpha/beta fold hydrolase [Candidatus Nanopelagicales bacterium]
MSLVPSQRWDLPHGQVHVRRSGRGDAGRPAAVLIHGLGGSSLNWLDLMPLLEDEVDLVAVDLPGFGASPPPRDGDYSPAGHARTVAALIESWQEERGTAAPVHVVGNSLGGAVSVQLAGRRPDLVASLTLISPALPTVRVGRGNVHLPVVAVPGLGESLAERYRAVPPEQRVQATIDACFADPSSISPTTRDALIAEVAERDLLPYPKDALLSSLRGLLGTFLDPSPQRPWSLARRIRRPVLAIYGEGDVLVDPRGARRAARSFPQVEVALLSDCGHVAQMEHPELVAEMWRRSFLARNPATRAVAGP